MHAILAEDFYSKYSHAYNFSAPQADAGPEQKLNISAECLLQSFIKKYSANLPTNKGFFSSQQKPEFQYKSATLEYIIEKAFTKEGELCRKVIRELQWIDDKGLLNLNIPVLGTAMEKVQAGNCKTTELIH